MAQLKNKMIYILLVAVLCFTPVNTAFATDEGTHIESNTVSAQSEGIPYHSENTVPISEPKNHMVDIKPTPEIVQMEVSVDDTPVQVEVPLDNAPEQVIIPLEDAQNVLEILRSDGPIDLTCGESNSPESSIIEVILPTELPFVIDPFEIADRGQIYSEDFVVENLSDVDIAVSFQSFQYIFSNKKDFTSLEEPIDSEDSFRKKSIYMVVKTSTPELREILVTDDVQYEDEPFVLSAYNQIEDTDIEDEVEAAKPNTLTFGLEGNVSTDAEVASWHDSDIKIQVSFEITPILSSPSGIEMPVEEEGIMDAFTDDANMKYDLDGPSVDNGVIEEQIDMTVNTDKPIELDNQANQTDSSGNADRDNNAVETENHVPSKGGEEQTSTKEPENRAPTSDSSDASSISDSSGSSSADDGS